ncbi:MAG: hypothetical protein H7A39_00200 [Chlamydiales bacterium]|nr:hypothetical protein [Chlamydiales bacterium]
MVKGVCASAFCHPGTLPPLHSGPLRPAPRRLPMGDMTASTIMSPLTAAKPNGEQSRDKVSPPSAKPDSEPSCCSYIGECVSACWNSLCQCLKSIFYCSSQEDLNFVEVAKREVKVYEGQKGKLDKFDTLIKIAKIYHEHPEIQDQYRAVVNKLEKVDFQPWLDVNSTLTFATVKQNPELMERAADYARAYLKREEIRESNKSPKGLLSILAIPIRHEQDKKAFQMNSYRACVLEMLPRDERHLTQEAFLKKYHS